MGGFHLDWFRDFGNRCGGGVVSVVVRLELMVSGPLPAGLDRPDWQDDAACRGSDPAKFFATRRGWTTENRAAKATCRCCPVRQACLDFALGTHQRHGIWGGLTERERRGLMPGDPVELFDCGECA
jgi:WhiB family redox-sensing transcriptional regulator